MSGRTYPTSNYPANKSVLFDIACTMFASIIKFRAAGFPSMSKVRVCWDLAEICSHTQITGWIHFHDQNVNRYNLVLYYDLDLLFSNVLVYTGNRASGLQANN
jgi:hypothetical protein